MKKTAILLSLLIFLGVGITAAVYTAREVPVTYDGSKTDVYSLMQENKNDRDAEDRAEGEEEYLPENPDGIASIIVATDLATTEAVNDVSSVVFDYRGYDTMGESFILLSAIAGSYIILKNVKPGKEDDDEE